MGKVGRFFLGMISIAFLISSIKTMGDSVARGFYLLTAAILFWPAVIRWVEKISGKAWLAPVAAFLALALTGFTINSPETSSGGQIIVANTGEGGKIQTRQALRKLPKWCSDDTRAYIMSRRFVERELKAPSTAKFPSFYSDGVVVRGSGDCRFSVTAHVDAQNSFGAMVRTNYSIEMEYLPSEELWKGSNLKM